MINPNSSSGVALSAITDEDRAFLASLVVSPITTGTSGQSAERPISRKDTHYDTVLRTAAFLGGFEPPRLFPSAQENDLKKLLADCTVSTDGTSSRWTLCADSRARVLTEMASYPDGLAQGVEEAKRYLKSSGEQADDVTQALLDIAEGKPPKPGDFTGMSKEVLAANRAVLGWLRSVDQMLGFDANALLADIELTELLEPLRFLIGFDPVTGNDLFVGRNNELRQLRTFVDLLASEGLLESVHRGSRRIIGKDRRILFLSGVGGVGKSALLAKFILQHVDKSNDAPLRFAYLDFDRSTIAPSQPSTLILEILRQLGWQLPTARNGLDALRNRIRQEMERTKRETKDEAFTRIPTSYSESGGQEDVLASGDQELPPEFIGPSFISTYLHEAAQILLHDCGSEMPILLVLDTFEEVQALGDQAVTRIQAFIEMAQEGLAGLNVVLSGRDEATGFFPNAERMVVSEFSDVASRAAFLEKRGLSTQVADSVARLVGGRPLTLLLAARLVKEQNLDSVSVSLTDKFRGLFNKYLLDGILYQRILEHIKDDDVRAMAHPGLVLRRIDVEVLQRVVGPVLGLGEISDGKAKRTLAALRHQKDLVRVELDGSVTHRADVREQMLVLMSKDKPEMVRRLHAAAASYYAARQTEESKANTQDRDRIEEIYHRLSIGDALERIPQLWSSKARLGLAKSVNEIENSAGRGTLKVLLGRVPTAEELSALPIDIRREYATRAIRTAISVQNPERALQILNNYAELLPPDFRRSIEPQALDRSGQWARAHSLFTEWVNEVRSKLSPADALAAADFFERNTEGDYQRETMVGLLMNLGSGEINSDVWGLPLSVATLRLRIRQDGYGKRRISYKEIDLASGKSPLPISDLPNTHQQWLLTLTDEIDRYGPQVMESMPVTDSVRSQLVYLKQLLMDGLTQSDEAELGIKVCDALSIGEAVGMQAHQWWLEPAGQRIVPLILRHLVRPTTPQWYVPIACLLRRELGKSVFSADLYETSLPELPFKASETLRTTKSLADFLGRLDQLGVLHICLKSLLLRRIISTGNEASELVNAYLEWRSSLLFDVDDWFGKFERIRQILGKTERL